MLVCGINHHTTPLDIRERAAFTPEHTFQALKDLLKTKAVKEAAILSTCNRVELYSDLCDTQWLSRWLAEQHQLNEELLTPYLYFHQGHEAVRHIMRVASGLDSMVMGEAQIFGQLKEAFSIACQAGSIGKLFQRLFQVVFAITKQVRTDTQIGTSPVSIAYAATHLAKHIFNHLSKKSVLLIGAGEIAEMTAMHLYSQGVKRIIVANRSEYKAEQIAKKFFGHWISMMDIPVYLKEADIVISATASESPILEKSTVERVLKARKRRPLFMVDFAVPRDIAPSVRELEDVYLYDIDDLGNVITENLKSRRVASQQAEIMIELQAAHFMRDLRTLDAAETIRDYREKMENLRDEELKKALTQLSQGEDAEKILTLFATQFTNKIMHDPSVQLRQAAFDGRFELIAWARYLFDV